MSYSSSSFAMKSNRILTATPKTLISFNSGELLKSIQMSEGRTVGAVARVRGTNICDGVSNAEMCAAFGADIVYIGSYDPNNPYIPGLPSKIKKNPDDSILAQVQAELGRGWTLNDTRILIGRPVAATVWATEKTFTKRMEASFARVEGTPENAKKLIEQGADIIQYVDWTKDTKTIAKTLEALAKEVQNKAILEYSRPHGSGLFDQMVTGDLITAEEIKVAIEAGAQIVSIPAVGTFPGYSIDFTKKLVETIHENGALASLWFGTSQEGADTETVRRIALYSKMAGADMQVISDAGLSESMPLPENIMTLSIAIRGIRHTYRRMAISPLR